MSGTLIAVLILAIAIGLSLGLLGGGGSILTVPLLTYVAGMDPKEAIAASLFVVGATSVLSTLTHARMGNVQWRTGLIFGVASMAGAFLGGLLGGQIPGVILMLAFAAMMIATAVAMLRGRKARPVTNRRSCRSARSSSRVWSSAWSPASSARAAASSSAPPWRCSAD